MKKLRHIEKFEVCALCDSDKGLSQSHIIPKFVIKWFKDTSPSGYLRHGKNVNIRQQDGQKVKLLCSKCENNFSQSERMFAQKVFLPFHKNELVTIEYNEWLYKYVISISWRVLKCFEDEATKECYSAMDVWSNYFTDSVNEKDLDRFEHHLIFLRPLDIERNDKPKVKNMNKYLIRAIDAIPVFGCDTLVVYIKMCRIVLLSLLNIPTDKFLNTKIQRGNGVLTTKQMISDPAFFELLEERAERVNEMYKNMTKKQRREF